MSPWELIAVYLVVPVLVIGGWLHHRYETDGPSIPEFEAWCRRERPVLFALRATRESSRAFAASLRQEIGPKLEVEHHGGRFPWTSYVLTISIDVEEGPDDSVVRIRATRGTVRRKRENWPDLVALLDRAAKAAREVDALWLHTELRDGDETRGEARRGRGWIATRKRGLGTFSLAAHQPDWVVRPASRGRAG